ncbi:MAG: LytTR family DNA-binding domain-containing protein [Salibacteraceae bacterium]|nr:LytTR family DNA-binding domain-containing protein [Salibacteraceae bacterium]
MTNRNYVIVEDEPLAIERLKEMLKPYPYLIFVGSTNNGRKGKLLIEDLKPDLIFLDIEMPVLNGFEMLEALDYQPKVIFTTAYENYALKAFEENSVDYLLKPIDEKRLSKSMEKLNQLDPSVSDWLKLSEEILQAKKVNIWTSITVSSGNGMKILPLDAVCFFEAEDKYVMVNDFQGKKYLLDKPLKALDEFLPAEFMRVHRSFIINFDAIEDIRKNFRSLFVFHLRNKLKTEVTCGNSYTKQIKEKLNI